MSRSSILNVTFDCADADSMSRFWSEVTRWPRTKVDMPGNPFWWVGLDHDSSPHLVFVEVPEPKRGKNRVHLDLLPQDGSQEQELTRLEALGARIVDDRRSLTPGGWVVMADPEGNEFCVEGGEQPGHTRHHGLTESDDEHRAFPGTTTSVPENDFDEHIARTYEDKWPELFEPAVVDPAVDFLAALAGPGGSALELGIGTGRIALPLSRRGVRVHGIELSPAMAAQLSGKPGAQHIDVTIGDFATTRAGHDFTLAYLVRNTITNLTTQDEQVECFRTVADQLEPGGSFVIEVYIPELRRLPPGQTVHPFTVTPAHLGFEEYDVASQLAVSHHYWVVDGRLETRSTRHRYVWPSELDLMARIAGMTLRERWAGWNREPFTGDSRSHISRWQKTS